MPSFTQQTRWNLTSFGLLGAMWDLRSLASRVASADIVIVSVGSADIAQSARVCAPFASERCRASVAAAVKRSVGGILRFARRARKGKPTVIRVLGLYNTAPVDPGTKWSVPGNPAATPGYQAAALRTVNAVNAAICSAARAHDARCVELLHGFNGPSGRASPQTLLTPIQDTPNPAGQRAIAAAIVTEGFTPLN